MPPYVTGEVSEEDKQGFIDYYVEKHPEHSAKSFEELYLLFGNEWNNNCWEKREDGWTEISTYNPKSKWDWYQLGGRWRGFFKLKENAKGIVGNPGVFDNEAKEGHVDSALKCLIDFEGMRAEVRKRATETADRVYPVLEGLPALIHWGDITAEQLSTVEPEEEGKEMTEVEKRRSFYHNQPRAKALTELFPGACFVDYTDFDCTRDEYIQREVNGTCVPYAVVKDGIWYAQGEMGWWGMSNDEMTQDEWNTKVTEMYDSVHPNTLLSLYDCHI